ncbi:hypothetical protein [Sulfurimonas sp. RIFOXYB12_FULL_35_9]|jgi:hypothetical protein|uniref:hypothetical protein n=1 Tax=Sulfurimonas sp. RIFOXYB12_FULL_35_9 TaxID=1802256 RepID=UPI0008D16CDC|nr:hypothetical protein [Sulfurimonas sp. RIFOXYB12_FULL_35_9]OHE05409.1 MAG: hypothetical protein A2345_01385 [Sulfurimonas sp. RIFOXYB12_FULL_35_9]
MKQLESFKSREPPKRRVQKLESIREEVLDLYKSGYQAEQIQLFAKEQKIEVSLRTISRYLRKLSASDFFPTNPSAQPTKSKNGAREPSPFLQKIIQQSQE